MLGSADVVLQAFNATIALSEAPQQEPLSNQLLACFTLFVVAKVG
jgi:hypothetical protein